VLGPVSIPIPGIASAPLLGAIAASVAVIGIGGDLLAVVVGPTLTLTIRLATDRLKRSELRGVKELLAIAAAPFPHNRVVALLLQAAKPERHPKSESDYFWLK
jgi:hypothetical protein